MTTREKLVNATAETIWEVLSDGWLYPLWVVGASRMRDVDHDWPEVGSRLYHSVGTWPVLINDYTEVLAADPGKRLQLRARAWPGGAAHVTMELEPRATGTLVRMTEDAVKGPGTLVPKPVRSLGLQWRNREALTRFAFLCENRPKTPHTA